MGMHRIRNSLVRIATAQRSEALASLVRVETVESTFSWELPGTEYVVSRSRSNVGELSHG